MVLPDIRRKVFISYYHCEDQYYKNEFTRLFKSIFINKSVGAGDINTDVSDEYIKRLIQEDYISDSSVLIVLIGPNTWRRKHVDWEISAALSKKVGGYSGLLGLLLPSHTNYWTDKFDGHTIPPRLFDNVENGYAKIFNWTEDPKEIKLWVEDAYTTKCNRPDLICNNRIQFADDLTKGDRWINGN